MSKMNFMPIIVEATTVCPHCGANEFRVRIYESILNGKRTWGGNCSKCESAYCIMSMPDLK